MVTCDFARIDVTLCHSPDMSQLTTIPEQLEYVSNQFESFDTSTDFMVLQFNNTQLHCELKIVDTLEDGGDTFSLTIWNVPDNVMLSVDDIIRFKYYWQGDSTYSTIYHGQIKTITVDRSSADWKTVIKGEVIHESLIKNWSGYRRIKKLKTYRDFMDLIVNEAGLKVRIPFRNVVTPDDPIPTPILTYKKTLFDVINEFCDVMDKDAAEYIKDDKDKWRWKIINAELFIFTNHELIRGFINDTYDIETLIVQYDDLLEFKLVNDTEVQFKVFGLPTIKPGVIIELNSDDSPDYVSWKTDYLVVDEIVNEITISNGYISQVYAHTFGIEDEDDA